MKLCAGGGGKSSRIGDQRVVFMVIGIRWTAWEQLCTCCICNLCTHNLFQTKVLTQTGLSAKTWLLSVVYHTNPLMVYKGSSEPFKLFSR
jgi:hypothetical protein